MGLASSAQVTPLVGRNVVVLDPAHGGQDRGTSLSGVFEKDVTLGLASSLRAALVARGFTVVMTREGELPPQMPILAADQRAGAANHVHPLACIVLHATPAGSGIHIATSSLPPVEAASGAVSWETAQSGFVSLSLRLANALGLSLLRAKLPVLLTRTALRPLDNLTCPAIAMEVSPLAPSGGRATAIADPAYQRRIAETVAAAMLNWRTQTAPGSGY